MAKESAASRMDGSYLKPVAMILVAAFALAVWQFLPPALGVPQFIIPTVTDMAEELQRMIARENLGKHFLSTAWTATLGFVIGGLFGATVGYLLGLSRFWDS